MKKVVLSSILFIFFVFSVNIFAKELSPQAKSVLEKFNNFFKGRNIKVEILIDKEIPLKNVNLPNYRFIIIKLSKGKRTQTLAFLSDGKYIIRDFEIAGKPMNLIENFKSEYLVYKVPVKREDLMFGKPDAKVKVVVFGDFECPFCKRAMNFIITKYKNNNDVAIYFKHFPLPFHRYAILMAKVYEAGKHVNVNLAEFLEKKVKIKRGAKVEEAKKEILEQVKSVIPADKYEEFVKYLDSKDIDKKIKDDMKEGQSLGVRATPTVFINGKKVVGAKLNLIQRLIEESLKNAKS